MQLERNHNWPCGWSCTCIDFKQHPNQWCKHIYFCVFCVIAVKDITDKSISQIENISHSNAQSRVLAQIVDGPPARSKLSIADQRRKIVQEHKEEKRQKRRQDLSVTPRPLCHKELQNLEVKNSCVQTALVTSKKVPKCGICLRHITIAPFKCAACCGVVHYLCMIQWDKATQSIHQRNYRICVYCRAINT